MPNPSEPGATLEVLEPATAAVLESVPRAGVARRRRRGGRAPGPPIRPGGRWRRPIGRTLLRRVSDAVREHLEELALLEARNAGKPIGDARGEMGMVADVFAYYAGAPERLLGDTIPVSGGQAWTVREPLGVVGLIVPWNFPLDDRRLEARAGAGGRQHRRAEAGRADAAERAALRRAGAARPGCPRACSTSSPGRARRAGRGWSSTPTSPRSRSPARPRSGARSPPARRRRSSG